MCLLLLKWHLSYVNRIFKPHSRKAAMGQTYCGWKKSCTTLDGWNPINNGINHLLTGAGFPPSTVWLLDLLINSGKHLKHWCPKHHLLHGFAERWGFIEKRNFVQLIPLFSSSSFRQNIVHQKQHGQLVWTETDHIWSLWWPLQWWAISTPGSWLSGIFQLKA